MFNKEKMCAYNQELMDNFETYLSYEPYSPATVKHYVDDTRMFLKWLWRFNKNKSFTKCTSEDINNFIKYMRHERGVSYQRLSAMRRSLRFFCQYVKYIEGDAVNIIFE